MSNIETEDLSLDEISELAKTVFLKCCKERVSTTSWFYLGLSLLRVGELAQAEAAVSQANILDNIINDK